MMAAPLRIETRAGGAETSADAMPAPGAGGISTGCGSWNCGCGAKGRPYPQAEDMPPADPEPKLRIGRTGWSRCCSRRLPRRTGRWPSMSRAHLRRAEALVRRGRAGGRPRCRCGPETAGDAARRAMAELEREAASGGELTAAEYRDLVGDLLGRAEVRAEAEAHTGVRFWGTIEARIQGADLMILAGLNEGVWPGHPAADPWMNRRMRAQAGLTSPERRIGLAAHDFQQAASAPQVILTRALRSASAETVPSRWLSRLQPSGRAAGNRRTRAGGDAGARRGLAGPRAADRGSDAARSRRPAAPGAGAAGRSAAAAPVGDRDPDADPRPLCDLCQACAGALAAGSAAARARHARRRGY